MAVAGLGSGALVAALPAAAAAAAPPDRTGFATGMTNATKTVGGAIASSVFAIALAATGSLDDPTEGHAPLSGYLDGLGGLRGRRAARRRAPCWRCPGRPPRSRAARCGELTPPAGSHGRPGRTPATPGSELPCPVRG